LVRNLLNFVHWHFLDLLHVIVVIDIRIASIERSQVGGNSILRVIILHKVHAILQILWRVNSCSVLVDHKVLLPEHLV
jgi:hypothetical protein